jgi:hypothetical protein
MKNSILSDRPARVLNSKSAVAAYLASDFGRGGVATSSGSLLRRIHECVLSVLALEGEQ